MAGFALEEFSGQKNEDVHRFLKAIKVGAIKSGRDGDANDYKVKLIGELVEGQARK